MKINVKAKPRAYEDQVEKIDEQNFVVSVTEPPVQGRANIAILKLLADYFQVAQSQVRLVSGFTSRQKVFEIRIT
ncbi:MAG TPA: DUF167 domain-containing protein [Candidatus Paceibacterota bacterium]